MDKMTPSVTEYAGSDVDTISDRPGLVLNTLRRNDAPWPGYAYIISYQDTSKVLTYNDTKVTLAEFEGKPTQRWVCHTRDGWLGFANDPGETTRWLGYDMPDEEIPKLRCLADQHQGWESFCVLKRPEDGFVVFMRINDNLRPIGLGEDGVLSVRKSWEHWWGFTKST